jgi:voltage-gated potassium channel
MFFLLLKRFFANGSMRLLPHFLALIAFAIITMQQFEKWQPHQTLWWFAVTITTIGYGDMAPASNAGRLSAVFVMIGGIGIAAAWVGNLTAKLSNFRRRKMRGLNDYSEKLKNHVVIMGWHGRRTLELLTEIMADSRWKDKDIVFCTNILEERPLELSDNVRFVKGDLTCEASLKRAGIVTASHVIIYGKDDSETVLAALAATYLNENAHFVVYVKEHGSLEHIKRLSRGRNISIIESTKVQMMVQEMQDPGVAQIIEELLSNQTKANIQRTNLDKPVRWLDSATNLEGKCIPIAGLDMSGKIIVNPDNDVIVKAVFYIEG